MPAELTQAMTGLGQLVASTSEPGFSGSITIASGANAGLPLLHVRAMPEALPEPVVKLTLATEVKALGDGRVEALVSTENEDRDGDIIRQAGWRLDSFNAHPVLLADHNYYSIRAQIGEWEGMGVKGKALRGIARYYIGQGNPDADWAYHLATLGRAAYSVGFIPLEWEERKGGGYEFTSQELLEVSHVTVPSNREALQLMAKRVEAITRTLQEEGELKQGRVLSGANEAALRSVVESLMSSSQTIAGVLDQLEKEQDAVDPASAIAAAVRRVVGEIIKEEMADA